MENTMTEGKFFNALRIIMKDSFDKLWPVMTEYQTFQNVYENLRTILSQQKININNSINSLDIDKEFEILIKNQVKIVTYNDINYPSQLKQIYRPPLGLYVKGDLSVFNNEKNLAIIGSRKATSYGKMVVEKLVKELAIYNIQIISGLAVGIDTCAHVWAVDQNLKTLAVIGSGFNRLFPSVNNSLALKIVEQGGAIVSEYPINFEPQKYYFVARNRIISGLSKAVLIIEAQQKSGTLITAKFAEEQNRDILAVPNNIFSQNSFGTNQLIKEGAKLIMTGDDIIEEMGIDKKIATKNLFTLNLNVNQKLILQLFDRFSELSIDNICENTNFNVSQVLNELTILELNGIIKPTKNNQYIKII